MKKLFLSLLLAGFAFASVDINSASVKELTSLKGIGKKKHPNNVVNNMRHAV